MQDLARTFRRMLKEAGFDVPCNSYYELEDGEAVRKDCIRPYDHNGFGDTICSRPTLALAARWLQEVYNVAIYSLYDDDMEQWFYVVDAFTKNPVINGSQSGSEYDDYESAFEDGLREAIKLIKK